MIDFTTLEQQLEAMLPQIIINNDLAIFYGAPKARHYNALSIECGPFGEANRWMWRLKVLKPRGEVHREFDIYMEDQATKGLDTETLKEWVWKTVRRYHRPLRTSRITKNREFKGQQVLFYLKTLPTY